jgi:flagellar hook protein FlgE
MSILRSMNIGASGLRAQGSALEVVADNISNVNTIGYKRSRAQFTDILGSSVVGGGAVSAGAGASLAGISQIWTQGAIINTERSTDMAISGKGLFVVSTNIGPAYTRAGQFTIGGDGAIQNAQGWVLQGYSADIAGNLSAATGDLVINTGTLPAVTTTEVTFAVSLNSETPVATVPWDPTDPSASSSFSTGVTVYDSLGTPRDLTVYFRKTAANTWDYHVMTDGKNVTGGVPGTPFEGASGTLLFDTEGRLSDEVPLASSWDFVGATPGQAIDFDFGTNITTELGSGLDGVVQFGTANTVNGTTQNGYGAGTISSIAISRDGIIDGVFSNGQRRVVGQIAVANFASFEGLRRAGDGLFLQSRESGEPLLAGAQTGGRGSIQGQALEQSNVDLATEFVDLIAYQRAFQSNSKIIQTADEMYQEVVNLRR